MEMPGMNSTAAHGHAHGHMMHMTFFWGKNAEVLFSGWPGYDHFGMYILSLLVVFALAFLVEWVSNRGGVEDSESQVAAGLLETAVYAVRIGLAYIVMLAVMSFNGGVFLAAIAGHTLGFFFFGSVAFKKSPLTSYVKRSDLSPNEL
ncbi:copper transporter 1-like [Ipomoea triloba]|uniref:copper transporter 1-like n=1 Tax=Ipomoea triloba TaxID=35885 RepID=UPI00125DB84C|nr:copper transporter 1-like [Ipomoea triloba]